VPEFACQPLCGLYEFLGFDGEFVKTHVLLLLSALAQDQGFTRGAPLYFPAGFPFAPPNVHIRICCRALSALIYRKI
jgi:hypothetical protein